MKEFLSRLAWYAAAFVLAICVVVALASVALAHENLDWARKYKAADANRTACCTGDYASTRGDCMQIPARLALSLRIGSRLTLEFPSGRSLTTVNVIYMSPDEDAPFVICAPGCLFKGRQVS